MEKAPISHIVPSVLAAAGAVERLASAPDGIRMAVLARELGVSTSTCYRILRSLSVHDWTRRSSIGTWSLGNGLLPVALALSRNTAALSASRAVLARLSSQFGLSCKISVRRGDEQFVAARAEPPSQMQATGPDGASFPVCEGSSGAALLADLTDADALALHRAATAPVQTDGEFLLRCLSQIRERGWCVRRRILDWPVGAMSAPVRDARGTVFAALTFVVPEKRLSDKSLPPLLLDAARECGGMPPKAAAGLGKANWT